MFNQLATTARAKHNLKHWQALHQTRTLAFCISIKHADFMADYFKRQGVKAASVHSSSKVLRNEALSQLEKGELQVIFSVDLFNEGVDLPSIDTVLMLRPTESKIIFLQQLGRGLRTSLATDKAKLIVLDFIGNHVSFFRKPEALFQVGVTNKSRKQFIEKAKTQRLELPAGCFVNYDLQAIDVMEKLIATKLDPQLAIYRALRDSYGRRPVMAEFYRAGGAVDTIRKEYGQWLALVNDETDLDDTEKVCLGHYQDFFAELETTSLTKGFKLILLEALIELEGFASPPSTSKLAEKSFAVLQRHRVMLGDLPERFKNTDEFSPATQNKWHMYWRANPINAWVGGNTASGKSFFMEVDGKFCFRPELDKGSYDTFLVLVQEIVNYRFLQYEARLANKTRSSAPSTYQLDMSEMQEIPYFPDLRIACGHFRSSQHETEHIEHKSLPNSYGKLDPARHFIARATGNSMDGGRSPIKSGDYLLLELITPDSAGSNNGKTVAIEQQDVTGDDQYLLRSVRKLGENQYQLVAQNPDYEPIMATSAMNTIARFKQTIDVVDLYLHRAFMREEIPALFGLEFNIGLWNSGYVCPKNHSDQFLFATLNKQGKSVDHQYHDYFIDQNTFHWQSQNNTSPTAKRGKDIINHTANGSRVHLFVRKHKLDGGKGAPFIYFGTVQYVKSSGEKPMSVEWRLDAPLDEQLFADLQ